jgi:hypothetical protein
VVPLIRPLALLVIYFFMKHAEKFYHSPGEFKALLLLLLWWCWSGPQHCCSCISS